MLRRRAGGGGGGYLLVCDSEWTRRETMAAYTRLLDYAGRRRRCSARWLPPLEASTTAHRCCWWWLVVVTIVRRRRPPPPPPPDGQGVSAGCGGGRGSIVPAAAPTPPLPAGEPCYRRTMPSSCGTRREPPPEAPRVHSGRGPRLLFSLGCSSGHHLSATARQLLPWRGERRVASRPPPWSHRVARAPLRGRGSSSPLPRVWGARAAASRAGTRVAGVWSSLPSFQSRHVRAAEQSES